MPSAPRVNYSLLVMDSAGMMKMATGDGYPSGYRGLRWRNSRSIFVIDVFRVYGII